MTEPELLLEVRRLGRSFGGVRAVDDLSFGVASGEIKAVIGPNGAGKTTLFNMIAGVIRQDRGTIRLDGRDIGALAPAERTRLGLARTFQNLQVFDDMTVLENVMVGRHVRSRNGLLGAIFRGRSAAREEAAIRSASLDHLEAFGLAERAGQMAGALGFGERKLLDIARALATEPRLLLLDEPVAGLPPAAATRALDVIRSLNRNGLTVLLVEHDMPLVMAFAHSILVVDHGRRLAEGSADGIRRDPAVIAAYLGVDDA